MNGNRTSPQSGKPKKLNEVTISVPTKPFNPDGFKLYSIVITHEPELNDEQAGKKKIVEKLAVEAFLSDIGNKKKRNGDFVTIDGKTVLVFDDAEIKKACVVVKLNDGPERPDGIETYQRFFDRTAASPKVGWARVESLLPEEDGKGVVDALNQKDKQSLHRLGLDTDKQLTGALKAFAIQGGNSRLAVSMGCHDIGPKYGKDVLAGLVRASKQGDGVALATVRALLLRNEDRTTTAVRDSFFDARPTAHIQGVELRIGVTKTLHLTGESTVIMSEKPCHQLFFPATSLASLMDTHYRRLASAPSVENKQRLTKFFQGVEVKVVGGPLNATKTITDFSHLTPNLQMILAGGQQITLSSIYQQDGNQLKYEDLPSVNVGSKTRPFYVPAEACFILPNQPFRNHLSPALQRELEELKRTSSGSITNINARDVETTKLTSKADFHTPHGRNWERSTMNSAYVLFVEVGKDVGDGKGQKRFTQSFWKDFQMVFSNMSQIKFEQTAEGIIAPSIATIAKDVLLLDYVADTECSKEWVSKLKAAVVESKVALEQFALVFGIQNNADRPEIFKQLEQACNSEDLGIQSIGVNVATLRKKVNNEPNDGMVRYAGQIFRKMFARTPQLNELKGDEDLAFGIDVTKVSATKGAKEKYLISIALRDVEAKKAYGTKVKLVDPEQPLNEVSNLFAELLHDFDVVNQSSSAKLIVFRSGCTLPVKANDRPSTGDINVYDEGIKDEKAELASEFKALAKVVKSNTLFGLRVEDDELTDLSAGDMKSPKKLSFTARTTMRTTAARRRPSSLLGTQRRRMMTWSNTQSTTTKLAQAQRRRLSLL